MSGRVLVTGASGCIGRFAVPMLVERGWQVHAVASRQTAEASAGVVWHAANLLDPEHVHRVVAEAEPTHLLHLAWSIAPGKWAAAPENVDWVDASVRLLRRFSERGGRRFVGAGSCLEYDWNYGYCTEGVTPCRPHTLYGVCKNAVQDVVSAYGEATGLSAAWGRIFFLYGPHEHPDRLVASLVRNLLAGAPAPCSHGRQIRDYLYAADVAGALVALVESDARGAFNIASGQPIALKDLAMRVGQAVGRPELIRLGAIPAAATDTPLVVANVDRVAREIGWTPQVSLDAGLAATIAWWRARDARPMGTRP